MLMVVPRSCLESVRTVINYFRANEAVINHRGHGGRRGIGVETRGVEPYGSSSSN